jgi:membrane protease YdiL (CAAX protease family)
MQNGKTLLESKQWHALHVPLCGIVAAMDHPNFQFAILPLVSLVVLACVWAWIGIATRLSRGEVLVPYAPRRPAPWTVVDVLLIVVAYVLLTAAIVRVLTEGDASDSGVVSAKALEAYTTIRLLSATALANIVTVALSIGLLALRTGATRNDLGFAPGQPVFDLRLGAIAFAAVSVPIYGFQFVLTRFFPSHHPVESILAIDHGPLTMAWVALIAVVIAPIAEEFLFRVVIQGWLEAAEVRHCGASELARSSGLAATEPTEPLSGHAVTFGAAAVLDESRPVESGNPYQPPGFLPSDAGSAPHDAPAQGDRGVGGLPAGVVPIVATSALFALMHYGQGPAPIPLFFLALVLGYLYRRTHRVLPAIGLHMCLNGTSMLMYWMGGGG